MRWRGKQKISANEVAQKFLNHTLRLLAECWPEMARKLSPLVLIPEAHLRSEEARRHVYLSIFSTHYFELPNFFGPSVAEALRQSIWTGLTRHDHRPGELLMEYVEAMAAADEQSVLSFSVAAAALYEKLGGDFIIGDGSNKMASPTATRALSEIFFLQDVKWWRQLQAEYKVVAG